MKPLDSKEFRRGKFKMSRQDFPSNGERPERFSIVEDNPTTQKIIDVVRNIGKPLGWTRLPVFSTYSFFEKMAQDNETKLFYLNINENHAGVAVVIATDEPNTIEIEFFGLYDGFRRQGYGKNVSKCHFENVICNI